MENKNVDPLFPGNQKRWIRVLLKKKQQEGFVQMKLDLVDDLSPDNDSLSKSKTRKTNRRNPPNEKMHFEQLTLNLLNDELES